MARMAINKSTTGNGDWVTVGQNLPISTSGLYRAKVNATSFGTTVDFIGSDDDGTTEYALGSEATGIDANTMITLLLAPGESVNITANGTPSGLYAELEPINT